MDRTTDLNWPFHTMAPHTQYINCRSQQRDTKHCLGMGKALVSVLSNCIVQLSLLFITIIIIVLYYLSIIKLFLYQLVIFTLLFPLIPITTGKVEGKRRLE